MIFEGFHGNLNIASDGVDVVSDGNFGRGDSGGSEGYKEETQIIVFFLRRFGGISGF